MKSAVSWAAIVAATVLAGACGTPVSVAPTASTSSTNITSTTSSVTTPGDLAATPKPTSAATATTATTATVSSARGAPAKTSAQVAYQHPRNARFGFSCDVPASFLVQQAPEDGDGFAYRSPDGQAQIECFAQNNVAFSGNTSLGGTSAQLAYTQEVAAHRSQGDSVTYDALVGNEITVTGLTRDNQIYYERLLWGAGSVDTLLWSYPRSLLGQLNAAVEHSAATFRSGDLTSSH